MAQDPPPQQSAGIAPATRISALARPAGARRRQARRLHAASSIGRPGFTAIEDSDLARTAEQIQEILDTATQSWEVQAPVRESAAAALATSARVQQNRSHNSGPSIDNRLLHLPPELLGIIARKMGKRARLLCTQLCQLYGSPGPVLRLTTDDAGSYGHFRADNPKSYHAVIQSWRHPAAVTRLALGASVPLDCHACSAIEALPNLQELSCGEVDPTLGYVSIYPHTRLTSLHTCRAPSSPSDIPTFAPNLRLLRIDNMLPHRPSSAVGLLFGALLSLSGLQHLDVPFNPTALAPPSSFCAAMASLTRLTHLGLHHDRWRAGHVASPETTQAFTQALARLPLLSSVRLCGIFSIMGPSLGAALQALSLTSLHLQTAPGLAAPGPQPANPAALLPDISAMPLLRHLSLSAREVRREAYQHMAQGGEGVGSLRALELTDVSVSKLGLACHMLERLPGLTSLSLKVTDILPGHQDEPQDTVQLADALATHTQLQDLEVCGDLHGLLPCLAGLPGLTSLGLSFSQYGEQQRADLQVVSTLSSLRKLSLHASNIAQRLRAECMGMVRALPLLEQVQLQSGEWTEREVAVLVPPPEGLQRVVLGTPASATAACAALCGVHTLRSFGVEVFVR